MRSSITITALAAVVTLAASANASLHRPNNHIALRSALEKGTDPASLLNSDEIDELDEAEELLKRETFYDDAGKIIDIFDDGGDPAGEDEEAASLVRRRSAAASCGATTKKSKSKKTTKTKAHANAKKASSTSTSSSSKGDLLSSNIMITWYASEDLKNPACGTGSWDPTSNAHIGAIATGWKDGPSCGDFIDLCNEDVTPPKCVTVRRVDDCAGCDNNHVDLTKAAFKALSPSGGLDEGVVKNLKMYKSTKANPWNLSLFGPIKLNIW